MSGPPPPGPESASSLDSPPRNKKEIGFPQCMYASTPNRQPSSCTSIPSPEASLLRVLPSHAPLLRRYLQNNAPQAFFPRRVVNALPWLVSWSLPTNNATMVPVKSGVYRITQCTLRDHGRMPLPRTLAGRVSRAPCRVAFLILSCLYHVMRTGVSPAHLPGSRSYQWHATAVI